MLPGVHNGDGDRQLQALLSLRPILEAGWDEVLDSPSQVKGEFEIGGNS